MTEYEIYPLLLDDSVWQETGQQIRKDMDAGLVTSISNLGYFKTEVLELTVGSKKVKYSKPRFVPVGHSFSYKDMEVATGTISSIAWDDI